jgi:hypothetical protein
MFHRVAHDGHFTEDNVAGTFAVAPHPGHWTLRIDIDGAYAGDNFKKGSGEVTRPIAVFALTIDCTRE